MSISIIARMIITIPVILVMVCLVVVISVPTGLRVSSITIRRGAVIITVRKLSVCNPMISAMEGLTVSMIPGVPSSRRIMRVTRRGIMTTHTRLSTMAVAVVCT